MTVDCLPPAMCDCSSQTILLFISRFQVPLQFFSQAMAAYSCYIVSATQNRIAISDTAGKLPSLSMQYLMQLA